MTGPLFAVVLASLGAVPVDAPVREVQSLVLVQVASVLPASASALAAKKARRAELAQQLERNFGPAPAALIIFSIPNMISGLAIGAFGVIYAGFGWTLPGVLILIAGIARFGAGLTAVIAGPMMAHARERNAQRMREELAVLDAEIAAVGPPPALGAPGP